MNKIDSENRKPSNISLENRSKKTATDFRGLKMVV